MIRRTAPIIPAVAIALAAAIAAPLPPAWAQNVVVAPPGQQVIVLPAPQQAPLPPALPATPATPQPSDAGIPATSPTAPSPPQPSAVEIQAPRNGEVVIPNVGQLIIELGAKQTDKGTLVSMSDDVLFDFDRDTLRPEAADKLGKLAQLIRQKHPPRLDITGHTDSIGTDAYNLDLSIRRARSVENWLRDQGHVDGVNIVAEGHGKREPVAPNTQANGADDPAGRQLNRRVDILLANG